MVSSVTSENHNTKQILYAVLDRITSVHAKFKHIKPTKKTERNQEHETQSNEKHKVGFVLRFYYYTFLVVRFSSCYGNIAHCGGF